MLISLSRPMAAHARTLSFTPHTHLLILRPAPQLAAVAVHYRAQKIAAHQSDGHHVRVKSSIQKDNSTNCGINLDRTLYLGMDLDYLGIDFDHALYLCILVDHRLVGKNRNYIFTFKLFWVDHCALPDCRRRSARRRAMP